MNEAEKVKLISKSYTFDEIGQAVETEKESAVFAWIRSASASEADQAETGFKREFVFDIRINAYKGEDELEYKGVRYSIYRTYRNTFKGIYELYTQRRVGT